MNDHHHPEASLEPAGDLEEEFTVVDHPDHYTAGGIEVIDVLRAKLSAEQFEGFCLGNAIKYLTRAGHKGPAIVDYRKARWYLDELIDDEEPSAEAACGKIGAT